MKTIIETHLMFNIALPCLKCDGTSLSYQQENTTQPKAGKRQQELSSNNSGKLQSKGSMLEWHHVMLLGIKSY